MLTIHSTPTESFIYITHKIKDEMRGNACKEGETSQRAVEQTGSQGEHKLAFVKAVLILTGDELSTAMIPHL